MNVIAKSPNLAPYLKATATAVSNGVKPVSACNKSSKKQVVVSTPVQRILGCTLNQELLRGPRISSGVVVSTQVQQSRLAHTDIQVPDFTPYRRDVSKDPTTRARDTKASRHTISYVVAAGAGVITAYAAKSVVHNAVTTLSASADVLALAKIEVKLDNIPEGKNVVFKWRGTPVFVRHRPATEIAKERSVDVSTLRDPQTDDDRVKKPEWLIVIGVCTHLGCVPVANSGDFGGYYCPCHGSHYDASGRIRKGPAPLNLAIPDYEFIEGNKVVIG